MTFLCHIVFGMSPPRRGPTEWPDVAVCLNVFDETAYPDGSDWTFARCYLPRALDADYRLVCDAHQLWDGFELAHSKASLAGRLDH